MIVTAILRRNFNVLFSLTQILLNILRPASDVGQCFWTWFLIGWWCRDLTWVRWWPSVERPSSSSTYWSRSGVQILPNLDADKIMHYSGQWFGVHRAPDNHLDRQHNRDATRSLGGSGRCSAKNARDYGIQVLRTFHGKLPSEFGDLGPTSSNENDTELIRGVKLNYSPQAEIRALIKN